MITEKIMIQQTLAFIVLHEILAPILAASHVDVLVLLANQELTVKARDATCLQSVSTAPSERSVKQCALEAFNK